MKKIITLALTALLSISLNTHLMGMQIHEKNSWVGQFTNMLINHTERLTTYVHDTLNPSWHNSYNDWKDAQGQYIEINEAFERDLDFGDSYYKSIDPCNPHPNYVDVASETYEKVVKGYSYLLPHNAKALTLDIQKRILNAALKLAHCHVLNSDIEKAKEYYEYVVRQSESYDRYSRTKNYTITPEEERAFKNEITSIALQAHVKLGEFKYNNYMKQQNPSLETLRAIHDHYAFVRQFGDNATIQQNNIGNKLAEIGGKLAEIKVLHANSTQKISDYAAIVNDQYATAGQKGDAHLKIGDIYYDLYSNQTTVELDQNDPEYRFFYRYEDSVARTPMWPGYKKVSLPIAKNYGQEAWNHYSKAAECLNSNQYNLRSAQILVLANARQ